MEPISGQKVKSSVSSVKSTVRPQNKHLKPFTKDDKRINRKGKEKGQRDYATIYKAALLRLGRENNKTPDELEEEMLANGALLARKGDYRFYKDVLDRLHGTAVQKTELTGNIKIEKLEEIQSATKDILNG